MQHFGKSALRVAKNYTKGYSDAQAKVRDATSNDPWGPTGVQLNEIAQMTHHQNEFVDIMEILDKRLNDKGKNWRHVFKCLTVLDYCLHAGSENVVMYWRDNIYVIKTLKEFQYTDDEGKDQGANVRQKAKDIANLLQDESRLREARRTRANMRDRLIGDRSSGVDDGDSAPAVDSGNPRNTRPSRRGNGSRRETDEENLRRAIEESMRAEEDRLEAEDLQLVEALKLSEEEEAQRTKSLEDANANSLFDDQSEVPLQSNNPFPRLDPNLYTFGLQPQYTVALQPQFTAFNPYQQQAQQEAIQAEYLRQQMEWQQQQVLQFQQQQEQARDDYMREQLQLQRQQQEQQKLVPTPTGFGSKNPFAPSAIPTTPSSPSQEPPINHSRDPVEFNLLGTFETNGHHANQNGTVSTNPEHNVVQPHETSSPFRPPNKADEEHAHLASLFANRDDGQDTFGNTGILRYGHTNNAHLIAQKPTISNHNPFAQQIQEQGNERPFFDV